MFSRGTSVIPESLCFGYFPLALPGPLLFQNWETSSYHIITNLWTWVKQRNNWRRRNCLILSLITHFSDARIILDSMGSTGSSAIRLPNLVNSPRWLSAPKAYSCSRAKTRVSWGGGSMKSKWIKSLIPRLFSNNTTLPRLVLWILNDNRVMSPE